MPSSRLPTLTALFLALLLGAAPWRVCAHGGHGGVWVLGAHTHGPSAGGGAHQGCAHERHPAADAASVRGAPTCAHSHAHHVHGGCGHRCAPDRDRQEGTAPDSRQPDRSQPDRPDHCHCDDQPLVARLMSLPVHVEAPQISGWLELATLPTASARAAGVAPSDLKACRIAHEEDPNVLLR